MADELNFPQAWAALELPNSADHTVWLGFVPPEYEY